MSKAGYIARSGSCTLTASTAKTCLMVITPAQFGLDLKKYRIEFTGVTATDPLPLIELVTSTNATNSTPGTGNTSVTPNQVYGRSITVGFTALGNCTSEPTVLTAVDEFPLSPNSSLLWYDFPLGDTWDFPVSAGVGIRITPGTITGTLTARVSMIFERC